MKPHCYDEYAAIFDLYSNVHLFPQNLRFVEIVAEHLRPGHRVTDVGGGTGMFTAELLERVPWVELTFVEPSPPMMAIAAERLPLSVDLVHSPLSADLLAGMPAQDVFVFQRSLYSLHGEVEPYRALAGQLAARTAPGGHVAIYEMPGPYDVELVRDYYTVNREVLGITEATFEETWPVMERVFAEFNEGIGDGRYTLFDRARLDDVFGGAGFRCTLQEGTTFVYTLEG